MTDIQRIKLNNGYDMPVIGFGTYAGTDTPEQVYAATKVGLQTGYRHFDTARIYRTEKALGNAIKESDIPRKDLFITSKLWQNFHEPEHVGPALDQDLKELQMDYVDLYLMHWPFSWEFQGYDNISVLGEKKPTNVPIVDTWRAMECLVKCGKARSIGVSNFTIPLLKELLDHCEIPPAVNQVELHPKLAQVELVEFCKENNIMLTAFSPVGSPNYRTGGASVIEHPVVQSLAEKYNKSPVQVILNWGLSRGYCVIPKSKTPSRIKENLECYFKMEPQDANAITALGENNSHRIFDPVRMFGLEHKVF